ncbi:MAG TPA: hypothetical protein VGM77_02785 [Gemmatimonadales bacterium]|jgi:hypothetical protein
MRTSALILIWATGLAFGSYPVVKATGEPPAWRLEPLAVIVAPDGVGFSRIGSVLLDPRGGLMVVDRKEQVIYRYDDTGKLLGTVGRVGSGPSEFRVPYALGWLGDELMVFDPMNARILRWTRDAKYLGQWELTNRLTGQLPVFAGPHGTLWLYQGGEGPSGKYQTNFTRLPSTGKHDTIWFPYHESKVSTSPPKGSDGYLVCTQKGGFTWFYSPFSEITTHRVVNWEGQLVEVSDADYRLAVMTAPGDTVKVLEHTITRAPISDAEWSAGLQEYKDWIAKNPDASCSGREVRPASKPAIRDLATDNIGRMWVERYMPHGFQWEAWQGNRIVGAFTVADTAANRMTAFSSDRVALVRYRDEDGGYEIRLYRIRR